MKAAGMKTKGFTPLSVVFLAPLLFCSCAVGIEKPKYTVLEKQGKFELRQYSPYLIAETVVDADFKEAGNLAFGRLFKYISGHNATRESIAMTAPVNQRSETIAMTAPVSQQRSGEQYAVSFVMPSSYSLDTLPKPLDPAVILKEVPAYNAAVIRYSGTWSQKRYETNRAALDGFISQRGLNPAAEPIFARYNPPFELWFLRRNEVIIMVE
jgi:hypothetical protein